MLRGVRNDLSDLLGIDAQPQYHLISRYPQAMPRYDMGHQSRMDGVRQRLEQHPHLALCGNAYQGVGISDCVESGQLAAQRILGSFTDL
ncbi:MAG TPA: hypothetical protein DIU15_06525 [Deltaproteobacteria bacterium]|nr:hypothetical protein [Deltaproteobacteria bacterium]